MDAEGPVRPESGTAVYGTAKGIMLFAVFSITAAGCVSARCSCSVRRGGPAGPERLPTGM
ncbi:MAG TPA: hypothetical protein DEV97_02375 [Lachnospiraceae bacterium]|nr:hypothetical protein [Lachnospiraceae bacterium]